RGGSWPLPRHAGIMMSRRPVYTTLGGGLKSRRLGFSILRGLGCCVSTPDLARCQAKSTNRSSIRERRRRAEASGVVTVTVVDGYCARPESLIAITRRAKSATALRFRTCGRLYVYDTLLQGLAQNLQHMAAELRQFIQKEHAMVGERHLVR